MATRASAHDSRVFGCLTRRCTCPLAVCHGACIRNPHARHWGQVSLTLGSTPLASDPESLARLLVDMFPVFETEIDEDDLHSYHAVLMVLLPHIAGYLDASDDRTKKRFCEVVDGMMAAGGDAENAAATCLLEHASQVGIYKFCKQHLGRAAREELC